MIRSVPRSWHGYISRHENSDYRFSRKNLRGLRDKERAFWLGSLALPHGRVGSPLIEVKSVAEIMERAKAMGLSPTTPLRHYYWGKLEVVYRDPDGVIVVFTQLYDEAEAKRLGADETWGKVQLK